MIVMCNYYIVICIHYVLHSSLNCYSNDILLHTVICVFHYAFPILPRLRLRFASAADYLLTFSGPCALTSYLLTYFAVPMAFPLPLPDIPVIHDDILFIAINSVRCSQAR